MYIRPHARVYAQAPFNDAVLVGALHREPRADVAATAVNKAKGTVVLLDRLRGMSCSLPGAVRAIILIQETEEEEKLVDLPLEVARR